MNPTTLTPQEAQRIFSKIDKSGDCWVWTHGIFRDGYGKIGFRGKTIKVHRLMWVLENQEPITPSDFICHHCDNPKCCNPKHLFKSDAKGNRADQDQKLRHNRGERVNTAKLTEDTVREIRAKWDAAPKKWGMASSLSREYGVSDTQILFICNRVSWKHVG